jgi:hypothetical protein
MAGGYVYEVSVDSTVTEDFTPEEETSTYWVCAGAQGDVDEDTKQCSAVGHAYAEGRNGTASAYWDTYAAYEKHWVWNGPAGTAPGGTLSWVHDGWGMAAANGGNTNKYLPPGTSSYCEGDVEGITWTTDSNEVSYVGANASGSVTDRNLGTGTADASWTRTKPWWVVVDPNHQAGAFRISIEWSVYDHDDEDITPGTGVVHFLGGAICDGTSYARAQGEGINSFTFCQAYAAVDLTCNFIPNP